MLNPNVYFGRAWLLIHNSAFQFILYILLILPKIDMQQQLGNPNADTLIADARGVSVRRDRHKYPVSVCAPLRADEIRVRVPSSRRKSTVAICAYLRAHASRVRIPSSPRKTAILDTYSPHKRLKFCVHSQLQPNYLPVFFFHQ